MWGIFKFLRRRNSAPIPQNAFRVALNKFPAVSVGEKIDLTELGDILSFLLASEVTFLGFGFQRRMFSKEH